VEKYFDIFETFKRNTWLCCQGEAPKKSPNMFASGAVQHPMLKDLANHHDKRFKQS
jgi:hypothetical protein